MEIRQMQEKDLKQVCKIEKNTFSLPWSYESFFESIKSKDKIYLVAKEDESVLGYCGLWKYYDEGQITNVAVREENRNRQIGYNMLKTLIDYGKMEDMSAFTLEVRVSNSGAIHLYHKLGFEDVGIRKNYYMKPNEDALIMWRYEEDKQKII